MLFGVLALISGLLISPSLVAWMSPTIAGLILAIFLSWSTGLLSVGLAFRRIGLLTTPEERKKPSIVVRASEILDEMGGAPEEPANGLAVLYANPQLQVAHEAFLPTKRRQRGEITPDWALAEAKLDDAETIDDAIAWLKPKERMAVLNDGVLLQALIRLSPSAPAEVGVAEPRRASA